MMGGGALIGIITAQNMQHIAGMHGWMLWVYLGLNMCTALILLVGSSYILVRDTKWWQKVKDWIRTVTTRPKPIDVSIPGVEK